MPGGASVTISGAHHLAIKVRDLAAAERFYAGVLGLRVARRWPAADGAGERSLWLDLGAAGDTFLALETLTASAALDVDAAAARSGALPSPSGERPGHHLVALRIGRDQRSAWEARLTGAGVTISHRSDYTIYFTDPEGNRLGLSHYPDRATDPHGG